MKPLFLFSHALHTCRGSRFLAGLLGGPLLLFFCLSGTAEETVTLQLKWTHQFQFAGYYAAVEKGFYREEGLDVKLREAQPNMIPMRDVAEGRAEFGVGTTDLLQYRSQGTPVVVLACIFQHSALALMTLDKPEWGALRDLAERPMMIEPHSAELFGYLSREGFDVGHLNLKNHSFNIQDLANGTVDAMSVYETDEPFLLREQGIPYRIFRPVDGGIDFYGDNLFTTEEQIREHPARVQAFVSASQRGWKYAMDHPEELVDLILSKYPTSKSREHLLYEAEQMQNRVRPEGVGIGFTDPQRWEAIVQVYQQLDMLPANFSLQGFFYAEHVSAPPSGRSRLSLILIGVLALAFGGAIGFSAVYRRTG